MSTAIICAVLIVIAIIGIKSYAKKLTSGCCGASSQPSVKKMKVRDKDKSHYPYSRLLKVDGMSCGNCASYVENALNSLEGVWAQVDLEKGEALSGYHTVLKKALPVLKHQLDRGLSLNDAGAVTLLYIMAHSEDTNIVNRSSYHSMKKIQSLLRETLNDPEFINKDPIPYIESLDREFIKNNISPGGSADLLALTFFLYLFENSGLSSIL